MIPLARKFGRFFLLPVNKEKEALDFISSDKNSLQEIKNLSSHLKKLTDKYLLLIDGDTDIGIEKSPLRNLLKILENKQVSIVYSDFILKEGKKLTKHPLIDYQTGSMRDDFNFGPLLIFSCDAVRTALQKYGGLPSDPDVALYDLRLKISVDHDIIHVRKFLYMVSVEKHKQNETSGRKAESHFAYVAKENFLRQKKLEKMATNHLKRIGAYLPWRAKIVNNEQDDSQWKASIVIPVLNRKKTIADALKSALKQKTDFPFNIIVVNNHSTDGTTEILRKFASTYPHIHHLIPSRRDLGIGGCWNEAIHSPCCGRYVVQLDSDDLYSSPHSLQKIVNKLRRGRYAMVVGSYTIVNERLKIIPPGLIAHKEWTQTNGHNNLLRINGMGAPRAFDLSVIRGMGFPNVSYGEDYAVALRITREYKIGRIYENLYWCRRWKDNTDAGLSAENKNRNDFYKDALRSSEIKERQTLNKREKELADRTFAEYPDKSKKSLTALCQSFYRSQKKRWPRLAEACLDLASVKKRELSGEYKIYLQYNPARAVSSGAAVGAESIKKRPCFLCLDNLPLEQKAILYKNKYLILCNPAPIFKNHFTVVALEHEPQEINFAFTSFLQLTADASPEYAVFYNGPCCGASAPDHLHFQMVPATYLPFLKTLKRLQPVKKISSVLYMSDQSLHRSALILESSNAKALAEQFSRLLDITKKRLMINDEPMMNVICNYSKNAWRLIIFLRSKHRPASYFAEGEHRIFVSPGAVDMAGVVITPLLDNYNRLDYNDIKNIFKEVSTAESAMSLIVKAL